MRCIFAAYVTILAIMDPAALDRLAARVGNGAQSMRAGAFRGTLKSVQ
jgi:hypothetical protein